MQDIQLLNFEGQEVIDSRDVATHNTKHLPMTKATQKGCTTI